MKRSSYVLPIDSSEKKLLGRGKITAQFLIEDGYAGIRCIRVRFGIARVCYFELREFRRRFRVIKTGAA